MIHGDEVVAGGIGDILVADDRRPYGIEISDANDCLIVQFPAALMGDGVQPEALHGRLLRAEDPNVGFLAHMLQGLWEQREMLDDLDDCVGDLLIDATRMVCRHSPVIGTQQGRASSAVEFALRHLGDPGLGTAMLCAATGLSPRAVQKAFLRDTGRTPTGFITERRLAGAADLLVREPERSITDIAFAMGFNEAAFFSRCFRKHFGMTPSQWRQNAFLIG